MARDMALGHILDLRPISTGSPFDAVIVEMLQSHAMRLAVSQAMGPAPITVGRVDGACLYSAVFFVTVLFVMDAVKSDASTDTIT